jgi:hypothetical protein
MSRRSGDEASRQIPSLAKLEKAPKMTAKSMWKQGRATKDWFGEYKGISIRVRVDPETDKPTEISWYLNGKLAESAPVTCDLEQAKRIAEKVVDHQIETDAQWAHSEYRHLEAGVNGWNRLAESLCQ